MAPWSIRREHGRSRVARSASCPTCSATFVMHARYLEWSVQLARAAARLALERHPPAEAA